MARRKIATRPNKQIEKMLRRRNKGTGITVNMTLAGALFGISTGYLLDKQC